MRTATAKEAFNKKNLFLVALIWRWETDWKSAVCEVLFCTDFGEERQNQGFWNMEIEKNDCQSR